MVNSLKTNGILTKSLLAIFAISFLMASGCSGPCSLCNTGPEFAGLNSPPRYMAENPIPGRSATSLSYDSNLIQEPTENAKTQNSFAPTSTAQNNSAFQQVAFQQPTSQQQTIQQPTTEQATVGQTTLFRAQSPDQGVQRIGTVDNTNGTVGRTKYQYPETQGPPGVSQIQFPTIGTGSPNEPLPILQRNAPGGSAPFPQIPQLPQNFADLDVFVSETQTGRINVGGAFNSENGIVGQFIIDERNFDITRFPRNFGDLFNGTAWRGGGQTFRLEVVPGEEVQRYLVSLSEPYLFNTPVNFTASAYLFDRRFDDWDEQRVGARLALGYRINHDISVTAGVRAENVEIDDPRVDTSPELNAALGDTDLFVGNIGIIRDTRDHPFLATEGSYLAATYSIGFGEFDYSRGDIDYRRYKLIYQRPDHSGRHTLSMGSRLGFSGSQTPIFENYFAGGFSTLRGFDFRGASPVEGGVVVGGEFQWLNTLEYMFPLTADDMIRGVLFCDFGTVEQEITIDSDNFRVAPGFGFRVNMPAAGIGAPLAFDFAFPVASADTDDEQVFSFYLGVLR